MSCGNPHETDCSEVLAEVWLFLDQECDTRRRELLERHLNECSPCLERYGIEEHLKALLARKCGGDRAPADLKQRLRDSIRQTVIEYTEVSITETRESGSGNAGEAGTEVTQVTEVTEVSVRQRSDG